MNSVWAIAKIVVLEMIRRKDFYVLFILTTLLTLVFGAVNFFGDASIIRYLKEICLLLIWLSMLGAAMAVHTKAHYGFEMLARRAPRARVPRSVARGYAWSRCT